MDASDRTLRRLLKRESVARLLAQDSFRDAVIVDASGAPLHGKLSDDNQASAEIRSNGSVLGEVRGVRASDLAALLGAAAELSVENRSLAAESLEKYRELTLLYNVSERILGAPDIGQVATLICDEAKRFLRSDSVSVMLLNEETGRLELTRSQGRPYYSRSSVEVTDDLIGDVLRSGTGEIVNDVSLDKRPVYAEKAYRSMICSPLKSRGRAFGLVVVASESLRHYNASDLQLLNALASQGAATIDVANLYSTLKRSTAKPAALIYGLNDRPPPATLLILGAQHVFMASIFLVVPLLVAFEAGLSRTAATSLVSMSLIAMGVVTLLQSLRQGPVGSGYLAPQIPSAIYLPPSLLAAQAGGLGLVFGMTCLAGAFGLVLSQIIGRLRKLFPPEVCGVVVLMIGVSLIRVALPRFLGIEQGKTAPNADGLLVGLVTLTTMIGLSIAPLGRIRLYSTIIGLSVGYAVAAMTGLIDTSTIDQLREVPLLGLPAAPAAEVSLSPVLIVPFLIATVASNIKLVGLLTSAQKTNDVDWKRPNMRSIRGGIIADSIGNLFSGLLGGVGTSISASNVGLAAATGATARSISVVTGLMFIALAFVPPVTVVIALMPGPVMGAGLLFISCFLVISGVELIASRLLDIRRNFIVGLSILAGIGLDLMPDAFKDAPAWAEAFLGSPLAFATTLAVCLNLVLNIGISKKARLELAAGKPDRDAVLHFFDRWGAAWAARPDVIRRAGPAVVEWCEEISQTNRDTAMAVVVSFDEFRLIVDVHSQVGFVPDDRPSLERILGHLQRRYDCQVKLLGDEDGRHIRFHFEH